MKIAVVGSRDYQEHWMVVSKLWEYWNSYGEELVIVSGGAKGVDRIAEQWAKKNHVPTEIYKPDWEKHGKSAGMIRNGEIIANVSALLAFWDGQSKGTWNSIERALSAKHLYFVEVFCGKPRPTTLFSVSVDPKSFLPAVRNNAHHHVNIATPEWVGALE